MLSIKQKILKCLVENKEKTFCINEISKTLKIDYKLIHTNVIKLLREESIKVEDFGNMRRCSFNNSFNEDIFIVENERKKDLLRNKDFLVLYNQLKKINRQFVLLMFGSQVRGTASKHSDIDLLIVSGKQESEEVNQQLELLPYNIHLTPVSYEGFMNMLKSKEFTVVSESIKKNVILFGIEDYYRFLSNAK